MKNSDPLSSAKAIIAFLILIIAVVIFLIYRMNGATIAMNGQLMTFKILAITAGMLLITLLFLVNRTEHEHPQAKIKSSSKSKKKKK